jgi:hypothetical protein
VGTQPIGFGAISALSVKTAPFDVTLEILLEQV